MKKILSFGLFEAKMSSHFDKRLKERIIDLKEISLNAPQADEIEKSLESEIGKNWKLLLINSIIENTEKRILKKVTIEDAVIADQTFSMLMGDVVGPRRKFIETNANIAEVDI